jgi:hypothetical protein
MAGCDGGLYGHVTNYCLDELMAISDGPNLVEAIRETPHRLLQPEHCNSRSPETVLKIHSKSESI